MNSKTLLQEIGGRYYLQGVPVELGDRLVFLSGTRTIAGFGSRCTPARDPFLWITHPKKGVVVYSPSLPECNLGPVAVLPKADPVAA